MESNIEKCSICLENIYVNESYKLDCGHNFHTKCIIEWFRNYKKTCPMCRDSPNEVNFQKEIENLFSYMRENQDNPLFSDFLQLEDQVRAQQYDNKFYIKICKIFYNYISLNTKLKFLFILFISTLITTITTPIIGIGIIINEMNNYILNKYIR